MCHRANDVAFGIEGSGADAHVADGEVADAAGGVVVVDTRGHQVLVGGVGIYGDMVEVDVVDELSRRAVVLLAEQHPQVEDTS